MNFEFLAIGAIVVFVHLLMMKSGELVSWLFWLASILFVGRALTAYFEILYSVGDEAIRQNRIEASVAVIALCWIAIAANRKRSEKIVG